jgi:hypothetical protein
MARGFVDFADYFFSTTQFKPDSSLKYVLINGNNLKMHRNSILGRINI